MAGAVIDAAISARWSGELWVGVRFSREAVEPEEVDLIASASIIRTGPEDDQPLCDAVKY